MLKASYQNITIGIVLIALMSAVLVACKKQKAQRYIGDYSCGIEQELDYTDSFIVNKWVDTIAVSTNGEQMTIYAYQDWSFSSKDLNYKGFYAVEVDSNERHAVDFSNSSMDYEFFYEDTMVKLNMTYWCNKVE